MTIKDTEMNLQAVAKGLDEILDGLGFALFVFDQQGPEGGRTNYVSNVARADMIAAMKEVLGRFDGQPRQRGNA